MRHGIAVCFALAAAIVAGRAALGATSTLTGSWEAARTPDDERLYVVLKDMGKAEVVAEYDLAIPGQPPRRSRSTTFGTWVVKGKEVILTYAKIKDRLRFVGHEPLSEIGLTGTAPALRPVGKQDPKSRIGAAILWRAPHDYRLKASEAPAGAPPAKP